MYPLLHDYDPEVELSSFQSLSLPFKSQLERLYIVEAYLQSRQRHARATAPSLYRDFGFHILSLLHFSMGLWNIRDYFQESSNRQRWHAERSAAN
jgi:hypothetical protein